MLTPDQLEDMAFQKLPMPDLRSQADMLLFQSFRNLYDFASRIQMAPEQGKREKAQILEAHRSYKFLEEMQEETNAMWKRIEIAVHEYNKFPSIETADKVIKAMYRAERKCFK